MTWTYCRPNNNVKSLTRAHLSSGNSERAKKEKIIMPRKKSQEEELDIPVRRYSKIIEMEIPLQEVSIREEGLNEEDQHREEGLNNGNTAASKQRRWSEAYKKRVCNTFIQHSSRDGQCQCGRPRDTHPTHINTAVDTEWTSEHHSSEEPTDAFGLELYIEGDCIPKSFLRLSSDTEPSIVYEMMTRKTVDSGWGLGQPNLVVSLVGGEGGAEVKPWVQEVIRHRLIKPLQKTEGAWILTEGFDEGLGRCVGEAVKGKFHVVGITPWGFVHNRDRLVNSQGSVILSPAHYPVTASDSCCLEKNHEHFLLVDDGSEGRKGGETKFWVNFEEHLSTQHFGDSSITIPVLCMLIAGEPSMLERLDRSLEKVTPWLVLAGSGGVSDLLSDILENQSPASAGDDRVAELVKKHFPSEAQTDQLVKQVRSICQNRKLITFYHENQERPEDFDTVMIKALMPVSKHRASGDTFPYSKELLLAMRWNRENFASSQLFNDDISDDDINWTDEALKYCMTYALANKQFQLVRLFIEKKFDIEKYLRTYGFLEKLYSRVDKDTLVYRLLLRRLKERQGVDDLYILTEISLFEVSGVLKKLLGEVEPIYFKVLGLDNIMSDGTTLELAKELLKDHKYRNQPITACDSPWTHLFIWAVLQNHSDLAVFFWGKAEEPVLNALSACKMLKEMSKMEHKTETKRSMKKLSLKFENLAHDVLGSCYQSNEDNSFHLLNEESPVWGTNCVQMAIAAESLLFFNHDGLESSLSRVWWGPMKRETPVWKFILTFFCPLLLYTNLTFEDMCSDPQDGRWKKCLHKWVSFWRAPITTFTSNAVMYLLFLFLFAYVLLMDFKPPPPSGPSISECVLYFWVFTFLSEEIRQAFSVGKRYMTLCQRIWLYWQDFWNKCDVIAIILFIIGLICRMFEPSYEFGRGVLCINYMVFTLRLIHISAIHKVMGPKIIIVGKMMKDVAFFLFFLEVWLMAYGVANQALLYSYDSNLSRLFRQVFYRPYLYIFGEFHLEEINVTQQWDMNCTTNMTQIDDGSELCRNEYNNWLVMILLGVFLLVTNILLINLLIAILNNTFNKVEEKSEIYWRFQQYNLVMEYRSRPALAPPFIILSQLHCVFCFLIWCDGVDSCGAVQRSTPFSPAGGGNGVQRNVKPEDVKNWETKQKQNYLKAQSETERSSDSERIKQISDKVDRMEKQQQKQLQQLTEQLTKNTVIMEQRQRALETKVENALSQILDTLAKAPWAKPPST